MKKNTKQSNAQVMKIRSAYAGTEITHEQSIAKHVATVASIQAVTAIEAWTRHTINADMDLLALTDKIEAQTQAVRNGDMTEVEAMLFGHALTLQATFTSLSRRAAANVGLNVNVTDTYLKLALRAQGQCRATLETLAEIKNPRSVAFIKQGNFAQNQQINQGSATEPRTHEKNAIAPNELLTDERMTDGKSMDTGAANPASSSNPGLEAVGAIDRPQVVGRKTQRGKKCLARWPATNTARDGEGAQRTKSTFM